MASGSFDAHKLLINEYNQLLEEDRHGELLTAALMAGLFALVTIVVTLISQTAAFHANRTDVVRLPAILYYVLPLPILVVYAYTCFFYHRINIRENHIRIIERALGNLANESIVYRVDGEDVVLRLPAMWRVLVPFYYPPRGRMWWRYMPPLLIAFGGALLTMVGFIVGIAYITPGNPVLRAGSGVFYVSLVVLLTVPLIRGMKPDFGWFHEMDRLGDKLELSDTAKEASGLQPSDPRSVSDHV
jgi:hypothetical protein